MPNAKRIMADRVPPSEVKAPPSEAEEVRSMDKDRIYAGRAIRVWRLNRRGELPADKEVIAVRGVDKDDLRDARVATRDIVDDPESPLNWLSNRTVEVTAPDDEVADWAHEYALSHGMTERELPIKLRKED